MRCASPPTISATTGSGTATARSSWSSASSPVTPPRSAARWRPCGPGRRRSTGSTNSIPRPTPTPTARLTHLDEIGVDATVVFPNYGLGIEAPLGRRPRCPAGEHGRLEPLCRGGRERCQRPAPAGSSSDAARPRTHGERDRVVCRQRPQRRHDRAVARRRKAAVAPRPRSGMAGLRRERCRSGVSRRFVPENLSAMAGTEGDPDPGQPRFCRQCFWAPPRRWRSPTSRSMACSPATPTSGSG